MATAVSERLKNQAEKFAGINRVYGRRGRVLAGYGGTLGGYAVSLQKTNADKEDQIMQNKYETGEIGVDEMIKYLNNTANRAWLSTEDKKLLMQTISQLKTKKEDADYADRYSSGTITAKQYLAYKNSRLATLNPGSPLYDQLSTDVEQLKIAAGKEDLNSYYKKEAARISNLGDSVSQNIAYENLYRELSTRANSYGLSDEANEYLKVAGEYKTNIEQAKETIKNSSLKKEKENLVDQINLAINSYVNNEITPQEFAGILDQFQSTAISGGHTDLLKELNSWGNDVREDIQYGKAWDRGGERIKGPGVGTGGGGASYDIYGNLISGGGSSGSGVSGGGSYFGVTAKASGVTPKTTTQTAEEEDQTFAESISKLNNELSSGSISSSDYMADLAVVLADRKDDLENRLSILSERKPNSKVYYNGSNQKVSTIIDAINKELNDDWTASLGVDAPDYAKVGINDIFNEVSQNPENLTVVMQNALTSGFQGVGTQATPLIVRKLPGMSSEYVTDEKGVNYQINEVKSGETIDGMAYSNLKPEQQKDYKYDSTSNTYQKINDRYIDVQDPTSKQFLRYWLNNDNTVKSVQLNGNVDVNNEFQSIGAAGKVMSLGELNRQVEKLKTATEERVAEEQKQALVKKAEEPKQLNIVGAKTDILKTGLNIPAEGLSPTSKSTVQGNIQLEGEKEITPKVVKPTFASTQAKVTLTPEQNRAAGEAINKTIVSTPQVITPSTSSSIIKAQQEAANKEAQTLKLASSKVPTTGVKLNLTPEQTSAMAPTIPTQKTSLWDKIKGLFKR